MMFKLISILLIFFIADVCYSQVRVTVDEKQNVLIVRAPKEQQIQIKKIIETRKKRNVASMREPRRKGAMVSIMGVQI